MAIATTATSAELKGLADDDRPTARRRFRGRRRSALPYVLLVPAIVVLALMLGYPLVRLVTMSLQEYGLPQVFGTPAPWVGLDNFQHDPQRLVLLDRAVADAHLLRRQRGVDDGARRARRAAAGGARHG